MGKSEEAENDDAGPAKGSRAGAEVGLLASVWNTLSSMRLAVFVLIIFAVASLLGALLPQQGMSGPPSAGGIQAVYVGKYGSFLGGLMLRARMHNLYGSSWYLALVFLLCLSTFACACKAVQRARQRTRMPSGDTTREAVTRMGLSREARSQMRVSNALDESSLALRRLGYAVREARGDDGSGALVGRKFRWAVWASPILHFSLLLIVLGGIVGLLPNVGFRDRLVLAEGETYDGQAPTPLPPEGHGPGMDMHRAKFDFAVKLRSFTMDYYADGAVKEYESDVVVTRGGKEVLEKHVRVNRPLRYAGVNFYQSSWDVGSVLVSVTGPQGREEVLEFPLQPSEDDMGRRMWFVSMDSLEDALETVPSTGWTVFCHGFWHDYAVVGSEGIRRSGQADETRGEHPDNASETPRNPAVHLYVYPDFEGDKERHDSLGILTADTETKYQGHTFRLVGVKKVSILDVRKDPGVPLLYLGFAGLTLAMMVTLYLAPRTLRVHARRERGVTYAAVGTTGSAGSFERDFAVITKALEAEAVESGDDGRESTPARAQGRKR